MKITCLLLLLFALAPVALSGADFTVSKATTHDGQADGSAGIATSPENFISATDENNILRLYSTKGGNALRDVLDLNPLLGFPPKDNGEFRECDLEGAARIGDLVFWIGSHGTNKEGKKREERQVLFATRLTGTGEQASLTLAGQPYKNLISALAAESRLTKFKLGEAAKKAPDEGGLNIEAICADGTSLLIGFRNPIPEGKALIVPIMNPKDVVEGKKPTFGDPILLDLGGLGIRDITTWRGEFLIVAGGSADRHPTTGEPKPRLFQWSGSAGNKLRSLQGDLGDLNPEAVLPYEEGNAARLQLLSDDGGNSFRSVWITVAPVKP